MQPTSIALLALTTDPDSRPRFARSLAWLERSIGPTTTPLSLAWALVITYVASMAALAYAGADATTGGALAAGIGAFAIGIGVVWCARVVTRGVHPRV